MVKIVWTEIAINYFKEIFGYIAKGSVRYATITTNKIYQKIQPTADNPFIGRVVPEFRDNFIRELIEGNYRIIY